MREIKLRGFDPKSGQMHVPMTLQQIKQVLIKSNAGEALNLGIIFSVTFDDLIFTQFTGLKDKHGKEIYDGDILNWDFCGSVEWSEWMAKPIYKVQYYNGYLPAAVGIYKELFLHAYRFQYTEVLGNIYENPELCQ